MTLSSSSEDDDNGTDSGIVKLPGEIINGKNFATMLQILSMFILGIKLFLCD